MNTLVSTMYCVIHVFTSCLLYCINYCLQFNILIILISTGSNGYFGYNFTAIIPALWNMKIYWNQPCMTGNFSINVRTNPDIRKEQMDKNYVELFNNDGEMAVGISIQASELVQVYQWPDESSIYSYIVPNGALGSEYYIIFGEDSEISNYKMSVITSTGNKTAKFNIGNANNASFRYTEIVYLKVLEPYVISRDFDISGSRIVADGPVAVFCDALNGILAVPPMSILGKAFIPLVYPRYNIDMHIRFVVIMNSTTININGSSIFSNGNQFDVVDQHFLEISTKEKPFVITIESNNPLLALQTINADGTPWSVTLIPAIEQYNSYIGSGFYMHVSRVVCDLVVSRTSVSQIRIHFINTKYEIVMTKPVYIKANDTDELDVSRTRVSATAKQGATYAVHVSGRYGFAGACIILNEERYVNYEISLGNLIPINKVHYVVNININVSISPL